MGSFEVVRKVHVTEDRGYSGSARVQVTHIRVNGVDAYVREGRRASGLEHFALSSNARLGHKVDGDRVGREVLYLAAPKASWSSIAGFLRDKDALDRPVVTHARWTMRTAPRAFEGATDAA